MALGVNVCVSVSVEVSLGGMLGMALPVCDDERECVGARESVAVALGDVL